jgi:isopenicillin N synthase-like dioxygenase
MTQSAGIPVIDLSRASGAELVAGLQSSSCVLLTGLGAIPDQARAAVAASDAFFELSEAEKRQVQWSGAGEWSGWQPLYAAGGDALALERYEVALADPETFDTPEQWLAEYDQWPARPAELRTLWGVYYQSMWALTERLIGMLEEALDLPADDIPAWTDRQHSNLCVNHYLAQIEPPRPGQARQKPHTDHGGLTLLWTDGQPGLEAQIGPPDTWVPLQVPSDALLLQAGDLLHLWSRGTIPANNHRVVNPPRGAGMVQRDRYSLVYFHHPDLDSWITADDAGNAISAREHVMARQRRSYAIAGGAVPGAALAGTQTSV